MSGGNGNGYGRFIPREELGDFAAWRPAGFGEPAPPAPAEEPAEPPPPPEPSAAEWEARIAAARQQGYQDGYRDGLVALEGFKQSFAAQATAQVGAVVKGFDAELDRLSQAMADALARTALELARQVVRAELATAPQTVARVAADAVGALLRSARHVSVHVHPLDLPLVAEGAEEALAARGARLLPDAQLSRGGVRVESEVGAIDARIQTRWEQAAAALGRDDVHWEEASR